MAASPVSEPASVIESHTHPHSGEGAASNALTKKIGPLPGWAWVAIIVVGAYGVYWYRNRNISTVTTTPLADASVGDSTGADTTGDPTYGGSGTTTLTNSGSTGSAYASNGAWGIAAINYLIGQGDSPIDASNAINDYLNGVDIKGNATYAQLIAAAISGIGAPPEGALPIVDSGKPPTTTTTGTQDANVVISSSGNQTIDTSTTGVYNDPLAGGQQVQYWNGLPVTGTKGSTVYGITYSDGSRQVSSQTMKVGTKVGSKTVTTVQRITVQ